ncbi:hypothetical protein BM451_19725, partial [Dickeya dadantii]
AVAAAIARVKARKAAQSGSAENVTLSPDAPVFTVAQAPESEFPVTSADTAPTEIIDPRKAAVAAAIARVKARKAA